MRNEVYEMLVAQGFEEEEAYAMVSVMGEIELYEVWEQGGV